MLIAQMAGFKIVIRNFFAKMMDVMKSNIGCEPLEQWRKQKQTGTFQSAPHRAPAMTGVGVAVFKYVLHIKNLNNGTSCNTNDNAVKTNE